MRYFIVTLVVSLCWLHQDWFVWPILAELNYQENFLSWLVAEEHEVKFGIPAGLGYQLALSFATAAVAFLAVWKIWPKDLERWAESGGGRDRGRDRGGRNYGNRGRRSRDGNRSRNDNQRSESKSGSTSTSRSSDSESSDRPRR
ncbi:MAG: hypothetical protein P8M70_03405, partial [Verrucomicrobiota bacterium]|nr:hypothetical protein [Verrucomicrobiota bacterium]